MARIRIDRLIEYWDPRLKSAFISAIQNVRSSSQIEQIAQAVNRGDIETALRAVNLNPANFRILDRTMVTAFEAGGNAVASSFPRGGPTGGLRTIFQFNVRSPSTESWINNYTGQLITDIVNDQRDMIRRVIGQGISSGQNPRSVALDLVGRIGSNGERVGGFIGLTNSQQQWVQGYINDLRTNPEQVIPHQFNGFTVPGRKLRDRRFDDIVRAAVESGDAIPEDKIEAMASSYKNRALLYRAQTIARTETMTVLHQSQQEAIQQAIDSGFINADAVKKVWRTARDKRVRESHADMEGQTVAMDEPFITGNGVELDYPGDPDGPPEEIINCRCWSEPVIDFLSGVE